MTLRYMPFLLSAAAILPSCINKSDKTEDKQDKKEKPNIVFVMADDLGWSQLSCYGSNYYQTPNIDNLSTQGMRFTNAYSAAAVSSATRASLMTGKYPARVNLTDYIDGSSYPDSLNLKQPDWQKFLPLDEKTIAEVLKKKGYISASYGKWHLSKEKTPPGSLSHNPDKQGFDDHFVTIKPYPTMPIGDWQKAEKDAHNVDTITRRSIEFMEKNKDTSFFLLVSHNTVHDPLKEHQERINKYKTKDTAKPENHPVMAAMIERLDNSTGRIMEKVKELDLKKETIFIFYSDNGGKKAYAKQTPLRAGKGWLYEGGIRVPLIVRWPGKVEPGSECNEMVSSIDFLPTFSDIVSIQNTPKNVDGTSILPLLKGKEELKRNTLYWHYPHYHYGSGMKPAGAIRKDSLKLIVWYDQYLHDSTQGLELYNLQKDLGEKHNLIDEKPEKAQELLKNFNNWTKEVNAQMPQPINTNN